MDKSLIVDTDNCNYFLQVECYSNGTDHFYIVSVESWPRAHGVRYIKAAANKDQTSFISSYSIDCENGIA
ncbi:unnamed protein product, partial [Ixodes hexagonus]